MSDREEAILQQAFDRAKAHEKASGGCPQCTLAGIFEALDIWDDAVFKSATGLADGVGLTGDGHCGALSGGTMAIGYFFGRSREGFSDVMGQLKACILAKRLHDEFIEKYGTCRCADLQTKLVGRFYNLYDPAEFEAGFKAGMPEKCSTVVGEAARMATRIILEEQKKEKEKAQKQGSEK